MIASQLSGHCDVICNRLWRHQQNENRASATWGRCVKLVVCIVIYGLVVSCKKKNNVCILVTNHFCAHSSGKITLSWALKRFVTRVHTLFPITFIFCHCSSVPFHIEMRFVWNLFIIPPCKSLINWHLPRLDTSQQHIYRDDACAALLWGLLAQTRLSRIWIMN